MTSATLLPARTVHVAVYDTLADWEIGYLTTALRQDSLRAAAGPGGRVDVRYVGASLDPVTTMGGLRVSPDLTLADLERDPDSSALLVLPGSEIWHTDAYLPFIEAARRHLARGVPVAAICGATGALAQHGLLDARPHTSNAPQFLEAVGYAGAAHYVDAPVVTDGDLVTASGVAPVEFARAVLERLDALTPQALTAWFRLYRHQDPAAFHALMAATA